MPITWDTAPTPGPQQASAAPHITWDSPTAPQSKDSLTAGAPDAGAQMTASALAKANAMMNSDIQMPVHPYGGAPMVAVPQATPDGSILTRVSQIPGQGVVQAAQGVEQMAEPGMRAKAGGASKVIRGTGKMLAPAAVVALPEAMIAAPAATTGGLALGGVAAPATEYELKAAGVPDEYSELAGDVAGLAGGAVGARYAQPVVDATVNGAQAATNAARNAGQTAGNVARTVQPVVNSGPYNTVKNVAGMVPGVGYKVYAPMKGFQGLVNTVAKLFPDVAAETAADTAATKLVSTRISTEPRVSQGFSVQSATDKMNTTPQQPTITLTSSVGKGTRTADVLDSETQAALGKLAHDNPEALRSLTPTQKRQLVTAVKQSDNAAVQNIIGAPQHTAVNNVIDAVNNKVNNMVSYARANGIKPADITTPEEQQAFVDATHAYGKANGMSVPKAGYRGVSPSTWQLFTSAMNGQQ